MVLPTFELRVLTPTGDRIQIGPIATDAEASALARSYLGDGRARRVEVFVRHRGRWQLVSVIGRPQQAATKPPTEPESAAEDARVDRDNAE